ncbi:MAG: ABC transporter ATP-binding protein [Acidimicrobiales bacterium]
MERTVNPPPGRRAEVGPGPRPPAARTVDAIKTYGSGPTEVRALDRVTVEIPSGELVAIMGPSGSGKSTLLQCMAGLDELSGGQTFIGAVDLSGLSDRRLTQLRRDRLGFVFQAFNLIPSLTAEENIVLPLRLARRRPDPEWMARVVDAVGLAARLQHRPSELSGGQQQRVAVARALITRPDVLFADEPTGNLDSASGAEILGFLRRAVDDVGQTIVMVTHDPVAAAYADRVLFLADGDIVDELVSPTVDAVFRRMRDFQRPPGLHQVSDHDSLKEAVR